MPIWVRNNITVKRVDGKNINVKEFFDMIGGNVDEDYTINSIVKEPLYLCFDEEELGKEHILSAGRHSWRTSMWGVKWDATIIAKGEFSGLDYVNLVSASFDTAWCAPLPALITLSEALGEDYNVTLEATDEFLSNHCDYSLDYSLVINNGDIEEIPIEGDYEEWWSNVWGYDDYNVDDGDDGSVELISTNDVSSKVLSHSDKIEPSIQELFVSELSKDDTVFTETGEGNLWEMTLPNFIITIDYDKVKHIFSDCIVVHRPTNTPVGLSVPAMILLTYSISKSVL